VLTIDGMDSAKGSTICDFADGPLQGDPNNINDVANGFRALFDNICSVCG
jgi:hypothetical protein